MLPVTFLFDFAKCHFVGSRSKVKIVTFKMEQCPDNRYSHFLFRKTNRKIEIGVVIN